jgi:hypothetical protein
MIMPAIIISLVCCRIPERFHYYYATLHHLVKKTYKRIFMAVSSSCTIFALQGKKNLASVVVVVILKF